MGWRCPLCRQINADDEMTRCVCGHESAQKERVDYVQVPIQKTPLSPTTRLCFTAVAVSYAVAVISLGMLPGAILIEPVKPLLIATGIFPGASEHGEIWWGFYIVYNAVWPLLILLSCGVAKLAAAGKSFNTKTVYFLIALALFSLLLAKLCFLSHFVAL